MYIFADDPIGRGFAAALIERCRGGVHTRLHLDAVGCSSWISRALVHDLAAEAAYAPLLAAGARSYEYQPRMLHAKTAVVDGTWATVGTANMDCRSFFVNCELNLITRDVGFARRLEGFFDVDLADAEEVTQSRWQSRRWTRRLGETVGWFARRWV